jgi:acetyl esterase/lipase
LVLIYPAYLAEEKNSDKVAPEVAPTAQTPPTFIAQTQDDGVGVDKTMTYAVALQKAKIPFELHIYPTGGHGYGLRPNGKAVASWPKRVEEWMRSRSILGAN